MSVSFKGFVSRNKELASPDGTVKAIAGSIQGHAQNGPLLRKPVVFGHAGGYMGMVMLNRRQAEPLLFSPIPGITCCQIIRMHITGKDIRFAPEEMFKKCDSGLKMFQCFQIFHVSNVLADKGVMIPGQTEGVFQFCTTSENSTQREVQV